MSATPPVKKTGGVEKSRGGDDARSFQWFTPAGRRATLYEDVTVDTQPSPKRHVDRNWPLAFANGHTVWDERSTALKHEEWYDFRDPNQLWERPYYQQGAGYERHIEDTIAVARRDRMHERLVPEWIEFLRGNMQQIAFVDHGLWLAMAASARAALSDTIAHFMAFEAGFKQRQAQAIVLYAMDMENEHGPFSMDDARRSWLEDAEWQGARKMVEKLNTVVDWAEVIVAQNVLYESLIGVLLRRELMERGGAANRDTVTPVVFQCAQIEWRQIHDFTMEFLRFTTESEVNGEGNRETIQGWIDEWLPGIREAAGALEPLFEAQPNGPSFPEALTRVEEELATALEPYGLTTGAQVIA